MGLTLIDETGAAEGLRVGGSRGDWIALLEMVKLLAVLRARERSHDAA
jgi:hypothetical protein